jgi:hypothetical protein
MPYRSLIGAVALTALSMSIGVAQAFDDTKYPNLKGQWTRFVVPGLGGMPSFDQTKSWGFGQDAPLTPEYKAVLEASIADQANGGQGNFTGSECLAFGMPTMMMAFYPQEYVITPETTYILINNADHGRRIFTDGRDWPREIDPTYAGYSIGKGSPRLRRHRPAAWTSDTVATPTRNPCGRNMSAARTMPISASARKTII